MLSSGPRRWLVTYPRAIPLAIFLLVIGVTVLSVFAIERGEEQRAQVMMNRTGIAMASALERRASVNASYLRAGAALFSTVGRVDMTTFGRFVAELRLDADYRGAEGYGWAPVLTAGQVAEFERDLGRYRVADMEVQPSLADEPRDTLVPIALLQPDTARNRRAIGFDMYSEPTRRAAMDEAERTMRPTASGRVVLVQEGQGSAPGFLIFMPVFETVAGERRLKGFIMSPFNAQDFLASAAELVDRNGLGVRLYDGDPAEAALLGSLSGEELSGETLQQTVRVANRDMTLVIQAVGGSVLSAMALITFLFGLAVASLLMIVSRLLTQQALEDQRSLNWFAEQNSIRNSLTRELNHRVKNTLANVLSIVALTRRRSDNVEEFADGLDGRIRALSATHDLLTKSEWGTTPIAAVVGAELAPYAHDDSHRVMSEGPMVELAPNDALSLGLALHELATNATKYGSLSTEGGVVSVTWEMVADNLVRLHWIESGGPPVPQQRQRGFGTDLIEKIVAHELRHPVELEFAPAGVRCILLVPVRERSAFEIRAKRQTPDNG
ncbi:histidine kinase [Erythrobacter sp. QSSC1-22B]|uniref:CHASE domain-containing protein n=1 Tax=Erythrobacter sp. QSSC1-22B TaxID=1860125 RepID=UPI000805C43C|nr:CHASE domain-containing protein [Erythrobacter sp. QSSC1-22B]OBX19529.1 histidine kinase [Erythrobacter sp. QSSC1-22B]